MKKTLLIMAVLFSIFCIVATSSAWFVVGTITRIDMWPAGAYIAFERSSDSWNSGRYVSSTNQSEILAIALTAISNGSTVSLNINGSNQIDTLQVDD